MCYESQFYSILTTGELYPLVENFMAEFQDNLKHRLPCAVILNEILTNHVELSDGTLLHFPVSVMLIPASVVHIGNRHKIGHCFMMSCKSTVVPMQY